jgi:dTDP-4-amino-4,6-dideoxygalactose transaminase
VYEPAGDADAMPIAEEFADRHMALPLSPSLDDAKIDTVVAALESALGRM